MDCIARAKQGISLGLSILLILTIGPVDQYGLSEHGFQLSRAGRAGYGG